MRATDLQELLRRKDPAAVLVSPQVLDKVIKEKYDLPAFPWAAPHASSCVAPREMLFRYVEQDELDLPAGELLPDPVHLLVRPLRDELNLAEDTLLLKYWRLLFHVRVHSALESAPLTVAACEERLQEACGGDSTELRQMLIQDQLLPSSADARTTYIEFAAIYLEYHLFLPNLLKIFFPRIDDPKRVDELLRRDVDAARLWATSRLPGAPDPVYEIRHLKDEANQFYWRLLEQAEQAAQADNLVGAMILQRRAARVAPSDRGDSTREQSVSTLRRLLPRLQVALEISEPELAEWEEMLTILLDRADQGTRPVEAALLQDMQTICLDNEQEIYALDLVEWASSAGRRPIRRPLPSRRLVRITQHLRRSMQRVQAARLSDADRARLGQLLGSRLERCEERLRERFRPILVTAFHDVGLRPRLAPEHAAFDAMTEELLDRVVADGFFTFGELRDVIARNHLKLPDLSDPQDFMRGDPLLRLDRRLGNLLDGVYRPSEIYLRILERITSLNFGTKLGRLLTMWITMPFGGALLLWLLLELVLGWFGVPAAPFVVQVGAVACLGVFMAALIHRGPFRAACWQAVVRSWKPLRYGLIELPAQWVRHPIVQRVVESWTFQLFVWYGLQPLLALAICWLLWPELLVSWGAAVLAFVGLVLLMHTRLVMAGLRVVAQAFRDLLDLIHAGLLPGLVRLVISVFSQVLHSLEAALFTVDEWLRFRGGEAWPSTALRVVLNLLWFPIAYVGRFYLVVLIEPCLNPLKLPVASIATKLLLPFLPAFNRGMAEVLSPVTGSFVAELLAGVTTFFLPDAFGFLFWELKENWRLYRANRSPTLRPAIIGTRGETMAGLLHRGFHSGTIPKLFAKLRAATRLASETGDFYDTRHYQQKLDAIAARMSRFAHNELVAPLRHAMSWRGRELRVEQAQLANQRVRIRVAMNGDATLPLVLDFGDYAGWLTVRIAQRGWLDDLTDEQRRALTTALAQLYKLAGVHVVWEMWQDALGDIEALAWTDQRLTLRRVHAVAAYNLIAAEGPLTAVTPDGAPLDGAPLDGDAAGWPSLPAEQVLYYRLPLTWATVFSNWSSDQQGRGHPPLLVAGRAVELLGRRTERTRDEEEVPESAA